MGRRAILLGASALLSACALQPPPRNAAPYATHTPPAPQTRPTEAHRTPDPSASVNLSETSAEDGAIGTPAAATQHPEADATTVPTTGSNHIPAANAYAVPGVTVHSWLATRTGPAAKTAFLTFDDGPSAITPQVLDALKALHVPATFFVIGRSLELNPAPVQRAMAEGHAICIHSYSHDYAYLYPGRTGNVVNIAGDYDQALSVAKRVLGPTYAPGAYRYPGGHMSWTGLEDADIALAQRGVTWIDWNCMSGDADIHPPTTPDEAMARLTKSFAQAGSPSAAVMLSHDKGGAHVTLATLPRFVQFFRDRGYGFGVIG
jgi:peptidoglycan-N-acetylglucosamine deacetylase